MEAEEAGAACWAWPAPPHFLCPAAAAVAAAAHAAWLAARFLILRAGTTAAGHWAFWASLWEAAEAFGVRLP